MQMKKRTATTTCLMLTFKCAGRMFFASIKYLHICFHTFFSTALAFSTEKSTELSLLSSAAASGCRCTRRDWVGVLCLWKWWYGSGGAGVRVVGGTVLDVVEDVSGAGGSDGADCTRGSVIAVGTADTGGTVVAVSDVFSVVAGSAAGVVAGGAVVTGAGGTDGSSEATLGGSEFAVGNDADGNGDGDKLIWSS